jgi:hypothetical protein
MSTAVIGLFHAYCSDRSSPCQLQWSVCPKSTAVIGLFHVNCSDRSAPCQLQWSVCSMSTAVIDLFHVNCSDQSVPCQLQWSVCSMSTAVIGLLHIHCSDRSVHVHCSDGVVTPLFLCSPHSIPHTNLQRSAEGGRAVYAEPETLQYHRNKTRRFVLVQRHKCLWSLVPMCTRSHLFRGVLQEGTLKEMSGKTLSNVERKGLKFQKLVIITWPCGWR